MTGHPPHPDDGPGADHPTGRGVGLARRAAPRLLAGLAGAVLLVTLAIANAAGYRYGVADQAFYFPSIYQAIDPALYPRDAELLEAQSRLMVSDEATAWLVGTLGLPLEPLTLAAHVFGLLLFFAGVWSLGRRVASSAWTAAACCLAMTLRHRITETGANTFEGYYHPRGLAFACGVAAAAAVAHSRLALGWGCAIVALVLHPTTGLWWLVWLLAATFVLRPQWRRWLAAGSTVAGLMAGAILSMTSWAERLRVMDAAWIEPFASKDYVFPTAWSAGPWLANLVLPAIVIAVWRWRVRQRVDAPWEGGAVAGVVVLTTLFLVSLPFIDAHVALAVQLQTSRVFWIADLFATLALVWWLAEAGSQASRRRPLLLACLLLAASAGRGFYATRIEHPERAFVQRGLVESDWVRTGRWLDARLPRDAHVLADPDHDWKFGHSVRITARRDVLAEGVKDAAVAIYDRDIALRVRDRLAAIGDFSTLDAGKARALAQRYDLDVLVIDRDLPLTQLHRDGRFRVYRLQ